MPELICCTQHSISGEVSIGFHLIFIARRRNALYKSTQFCLQGCQSRTGACLVSDYAVRLLKDVNYGQVFYAILEHHNI